MRFDAALLVIALVLSLAVALSKHDPPNTGGGVA